MKVIRTFNAKKDYQYWIKHDKKIVKRINRLIEDIKKHPFTGIGKPEPLSADYAGQWSRRITKIHRITYHVTDDIVTITRMRDHYPAK